MNCGFFFEIGLGSWGRGMGMDGDAGGYRSVARLS